VTGTASAISQTVTICNQPAFEITNCDHKQTVTSCNRLNPVTFTSFEPAGISGQLPAPSRTDEVVKRVIFAKLRVIKRNCERSEGQTESIIVRHCGDTVTSNHHI
jgi:hypothetical protein